jgi:hypothetical protein
VNDEPPVRIGLRVADVVAAAALYERFGFVPVGTVPDRDGQVVMAVLRRGPLQLLVDALVGMPFPDSVRGPRPARGSDRPWPTTTSRWTSQARAGAGDIEAGSSWPAAISSWRRSGRPAVGVAGHGDLTELVA